MATHDYVIANASGSSVRSDLNNALAAIVSNNSSSSEPSTKYAYMLWADTTNGVLKIRNSANNAWIELLQLDGTLTMEDGAEATPGLAFRDDLNTGIWSSAADTFNISTGGTERLELGAATVFNESGADVDFRIEGDTNANLFYVDAGNDRIGIGTNSPSTLLHIDSDSTDTTLTIESDLDGSSLFTSGIDFKREGTSKGSRIESLRDASAGGVGLNLSTTANNTAETNGTLTSRFRIKSDGNITPGTNNATSIGDGTTNFNSIWASTRFRGNDDVKLILGDAQDLQLWHGGGHSYVMNQIGNLNLRINSSEDGIIIVPNGAVQLFHDNDLRYTTASGYGVHYGHFSSNANGSHDLGFSGSRWRNLYLSGSVTSSDKNEKNTITKSDLGLDFIKNLNPVSFKWNKETLDDKTHYGLIAQEVEETILNMGKKLEDFGAVDKPTTQEEGNMGLNYTELIAPLIKAVQELSAKVTALEAK